jgi:hypothetical protein
MGRHGFDALTGVPAVIDAGAHGGPTVDAALHAQADAICPRCLGWIADRDYVRRNGIDLLEHESCPPRPRPRRT